MNHYGNLLKVYKEVFEEDGETVKLCGREKCKELIQACMAIEPFRPTGFFGNPENGIMEKENITNLYKLVNSLLKNGQINIWNKNRMA